MWNYLIHFSLRFTFKHSWNYHLERSSMNNHFRRSIIGLFMRLFFLLNVFTKCLCQGPLSIIISFNFFLFSCLQYSHPWKDPLFTRSRSKGRLIFVGKSHHQIFVVSCYFYLRGPVPILWVFQTLSFMVNLAKVCFSVLKIHSSQNLWHAKLTA